MKYNSDIQHENILSDRGAVFITTTKLPIVTVRSLNSGSTQIQILLAVCQRYAKTLIKHYTKG